MTDERQGLRIRLATRNDNAALLRLTAASEMGGALAVRIDRAPDFFGLLEARGDWQLLVAERDGALVGCLSASAMPVYVDGRADRVWFLADFKVVPALRGSGLAVRLLKRMERHLLPLGGPDVVIGLTASDNRFVSPFHGGRAGLLNSVSLGRFDVLQIVPAIARYGRTATVIREAPLSDALLELYGVRAAQCQFAPVAAPGMFEGVRHLVAADTDGMTQACMAVVDVSASRQNVLVRAPLALRAGAWAFRQLARVAPIPSLPRLDQPIRTLYIRAVGWTPAGASAIPALLDQARREARAGGYHFLSIGLHERDPLRQYFEGLPALRFGVNGFAVSLSGNAAGLAPLLARTPFQDFSLG